MPSLALRSAFLPLLTVGLLALLTIAARSAEAATAIEDCARVPEGGFCKVTGDRTPGDCRVPRCIEKECDVFAPAPDAMRCDDQDGNACTLGACVPEEGICAPSELAPNGMFCPDTDGEFCTVAQCQSGGCAQAFASKPDGAACPDTDGNPGTRALCQTGRCNQNVSLPPVPAMDDVASVEVTARQERVSQSEAYTNCCWLCAKQWLEALHPTPNGPERLDDGLLPKRVKYCGTVASYGVNDEHADPRDITINILPSPSFEHFVEGFLNTECTPLEGRDVDHYGQAVCSVNSCLVAAEQKGGKCIHAEVTPAEQFYSQDSRYLPISDELSRRCNGSISQGPNGTTRGGKKECSSALEPASGWSDVPPRDTVPGQVGREVCVYGVYAVDHGGGHGAGAHRQLCCSPDAGHDRPEIHPFDAIWFRHLDGQPGWIFGVFQDDSNRYSNKHCSRYNNNNQWSQGPRDLTFRFPFRFPRSGAPTKACLRHTRTKNFQGASHEVRPLNVTTSLMPSPLEEVTRLADASGATVLSVEEPAGAATETQVRLEGSVTQEEIQGFLTVRVAVGCAWGTKCLNLRDPSDPGSGYYYGEIRFGEDCGG